MNKVTEREIFSAFFGKSVNPKTFDSVAYQNGGNQYLICNADYVGDSQLRETFGITDRLKWMWGYSGVDFTIYLTIVDNTIAGGHIYKAKEGGGGHGRCTSTVLTVSQQELRVARRILQYITN